MVAATVAYSRDSKPNERQHRRLTAARNWQNGVCLPGQLALP